MRISSLTTIVSGVLVISGCSGITGFTSSSNNTAGSIPGAAIHGVVHGGQGPISGAQVYLYTPNTTGYGGAIIAASSSNASISLLTSATGNPADANGHYFVTTASDGTFSITGDYTCPSTVSPVYLFAIGGNAGAGTNSAAGLLAGLGNCSSSGTLSSTLNVEVNEVSTIATAYAFAGFATDATHISSSGTTKALVGIRLASDAVATLANVSGNGMARTTLPSGTGTVPQNEIDTLANILATCVNSTGSSSVPCANLLSFAVNPIATATETATAAIDIAQNPGSNIGNLFALQTANPPFQPMLSTAPNDFTIAINQTSGGLNAPYGIAVDGNGAIWVANTGASAISEFNSNGGPMSDSPISGGGLSGPQFIAVDSSNDVWVTNHSGNLSYFENNGTPIFSTGFGDVSAPEGIAIDATGHAWVANSCNSDCLPENSVSEFTGTGSELSPNPAGYTVGGLNEPVGLAIDISGNAWVTNHGADSITELNSTGGAQSGSPFSGGGLSGPTGIAIDASGNIWAANPDNSLSKFDPATRTFLSGPSGYIGGGLNTPVGIAIDGAGNVWVANNGSTFLANNGSNISEFNSNGVAITGSTGYQGGGMGGPIWVAVDSAGNVWVTNAGNSSITKFVGAAVPVVTPIAANLAPTTYAIGGTIAGLSGSGLVLQNNGGNNLSIAPGATSFTFSTALASGSAYNITVLTQPSSPAQTCAVTNGTGTVASANITNVQVTCTATTYTIGGVIAGLSGSGLVLQDNAGDNLSVNPGATAFTFPTALASGAAYSVSVLSQPSGPSQMCTLTNGSGTVANANVTNVQVACVATLSSVAVSPSTPTLAIGLSQQFSAVGTYSDGTISNITSGVTWSSSVPAVATITPAGVVTTVTQGTVSIIAKMGNVQGSSSLTVPNATGGPILVNDLTDSRILLATASDQSTLTYFGNRDANGNPTLLTAMKRVATDGTWQTVTFDSQGRPIQITASDNTQFDLTWTSDTGGFVSASSATGATTITTAFGSASDANSSTASGALMRTLSETQKFQAPAATSANSSFSAVDFNISTCGAPESFSNADIVLADGTIPANFIPTPADGSNVASYQAILPSGITGDLTSMLQALPSVYGSLCTFVSNFGQATNGSQGAGEIALGTALCTAVTAVLGPGAALTESACGVAGAALADAFTYSCSISNNQSVISSFITFLANPTSIFWQAQLQGLSVGNPNPQSGVVVENSDGSYPVVTVDFECPNVGSVQVAPATLSMPPNVPSPLTAGAFGRDGLLIESSAFQFTWSSNNETVVAVPSSGMAIREGSSNFVTGQTTGIGQTAQATVSEELSGKSGSSAVTVTAPPVNTYFAISNIGGTTAETLTVNGQVLGTVPGGPDEYCYGAFEYTAVVGTPISGSVTGANGADSPGGLDFQASGFLNDSPPPDPEYSSGTYGIWPEFSVPFSFTATVAGCNGGQSCAPISVPSSCYDY